MLTNIHIENYALIDCLDIDINEGLNIITGETGAGKSIILGAIGAALGAKINSDVIRAGEEYSFISVSFHINDADKLKALTELDAVDLSDGDIIVTRKIFPARSVFKINGVTVSAAQVRSLSSLIIDIHSQRDNLLLLKTENQLKLVDSFGDDEFRKLMDRQKSLYEEYTECNSKLANIGDDASLREREISLLQYEIKEIEEASLTVEEDEELEEKFSKMSYLEKIRRGVAESLQSLESGDVNSIDLLGKAIKSLGDAINYDKDLVQIYDALKEQKVYINKKMDEQYPLMARGIYEGEEVQMIVMMWGLSWEKMTLGQANFLTVVSYLIQNAVLRAQRYMQALEEKRYSQNSRILEPEAFESLVQAYMKAKLKNLVECVLIKVDVQNSEYQKTDEQMSGYMRDSDYMGMLPDGNLYVLLTNTTREGAVIVQDRFEKNGYKTEYVEMMSVCHRE